MKKSRTPKVPTAKLNNRGIVESFTKVENEKENIINVNNLGVPDVATSVHGRIKNNEDITQLFPDVELSIQILVSSILSPNDMTTTSVIYNPPEIEIPSDINTYILDIIKKHINKEYKLEDKLPTMLREALFTKGAYIEAIIPNSKLETVISNNGEVSLEDISEVYSKNGLELGVLSTENYKVDNIKVKDLESDINLSVTDNLSNLNISKKFLELTRENMSDNLSDYELATEDKFYKKYTKGKDIPVINISDVKDSDNSDNKPTIFKLPAVATVPIHVKSTPEEHIGYFILLDDNGTPITASDTFKMDDKNNEDLLYSNDVKSTMIKKAKAALTGITRKDKVLKNVEKAYVTLTKQMIRTKLKEGVYGDTLDIAEDYDLYKIMFSRTLANRNTKLLYVPKEYMSYMAFEYRNNGTGKSLIEKVAMLFSIRSILMVSRLMANLKNSVTTTEVSATLSDNDPDPQATMEKIISETLKTRQTQIPIGLNKVDDLVDWAHKVGFRYNIKGQGLPEMNIDVSDNSSSKIVPDTDLDESIQEHIIMSFGLTKDMVMAGYDPEYATIAISNNVLLAKRVTMYQNKFSYMLSDYLTKLLTNDSGIKDKITNILNDNVKAIRKVLVKEVTDKDLLNHIKSNSNLVNFVLNGYLKHISISFPRPEVKEATNMKDAYDAYSSTVDDILDVLVSADALPDDLLGDASDSMDSIKAAMKTMLVKEWATNNNYLPEMTNFLTLDNTGKPVFNILEDYADYIDQLSSTMLPFYKKNKKFKDKLNDKLTKIEEGNSDDEEQPTENDDATVDDTTGDTTGDTTTDDTVSDDTTVDGGSDATGGDGDTATGDELNLDDM